MHVINSYRNYIFKGFKCSMHSTI